MKPLFLTLSLMTLLSACSNTSDTPYNNFTVTPQTPDTPTMPPPTKSPLILTFQNTDSFDTQLSAIAGSQKETIEIPVSERFEPDQGETPERLAKWIGVLKEGGGKQDYEEIKDPNAMSPVLISVIPLAFSWAMDWYRDYQERQKYQAIQNYHARFCYQKYDNKVEKVVFVRKDVDPNKPVCFR